MGRLDLLVNKTSWTGLATTPVVGHDRRRMDRVMNVTLTSVMRATLAALALFRDADQCGVIVNKRQRALAGGPTLPVATTRPAKAGVYGVDPVAGATEPSSMASHQTQFPSLARHKSGEDQLF